MKIVELLPLNADLKTQPFNLSKPVIASRNTIQIYIPCLYGMGSSSWRQNGLEHQLVLKIAINKPG